VTGAGSVACPFLPRLRLLKVLLVSFVAPISRPPMNRLWVLPSDRRSGTRKFEEHVADEQLLVEWIDGLRIPGVCHPHFLGGDSTTGVGRTAPGGFPVSWINTDPSGDLGLIRFGSRDGTRPDRRLGRGVGVCARPQTQRLLCALTQTARAEETEVTFRGPGGGPRNLGERGGPWLGFDIRNLRSSKNPERGPVNERD